MLLHLPIVILATLSPIHVSDTVPTFDIARERTKSGSRPFPRTQHHMFACQAPVRGSAGQPDNGDGYPSPCSIGQIGIIRLVRWTDPHTFSSSKRV